MPPFILAGNIKETVTYMTSTTQLASVNFSQYKVLYIPSALVNNGGVTVNGINDAQNNVLAARKADIANYVNNLGGSLIALGQSRLVQAYQWLPVPLKFQALDITTVSVTPDIGVISNSSTGPNLSHCCWHGYFWGPPDWSGEQFWGMK